MKNADTSALVDIFTGIFDLWGMPLLFAISGASIFFALRPGGTLRFLRDRVLRLLVPLALGILVLGPPQVYLAAADARRLPGQLLPVPAALLRRQPAQRHLCLDRRPSVVPGVPLPVHARADAALRLAEAAVRPGRFLASLSRFSVRPGAIFLWVLPFVALLILVDPVRRAATRTCRSRAARLHVPALPAPRLPDLRRRRHPAGDHPPAARGADPGAGAHAGHTADHDRDRATGLGAQRARLRPGDGAGEDCSSGPTCWRSSATACAT